MGAADRLIAAWWQPSPRGWALLLWPLSQLFKLLVVIRAALYRAGWLKARRAPVPVIVVGNLIVGGAGKTPTVIALVRAMQQAGWRPAVIARGYGSAVAAPRPVAPTGAAADVGDEPLLIRRATGVPVWVGQRRVDTAHALCAAEPAVNLLISDDGLQHLALARDAELVVFDRRGIGNGCLLPAGPLRQPMAASPSDGMCVLYNADRPSTAWPGVCAERTLRGAIVLPAWAAGDGSAQDLTHFCGRTVHAAAGIAEPQRFFDMLEAAGLTLQRWPLPDHHGFARWPWPKDAADVLVTEKDAVKLVGRSFGPTRIWVVPLDFRLPESLVQALLQRLPSPPPAHEPNSP